MNAELASIFAPQGGLARQLPAYRYRAQQVAMAEAIATALGDRLHYHALTWQRERRQNHAALHATQPVASIHQLLDRQLKLSL